jgi:hypothetical protein
MPAPTMWDGQWLEDEGLAQWATPTQLKYREATIRLGSMRAAAREFKVNFTAVSDSLKALRSYAARRGHAPGHFNDGTAPGYRMGKVTVQRARTRDGDSVVERVWERQHPDHQRSEEDLRSFVGGLVGALGELPQLAPPPKHVAADLLAVYAFGDPHFGMKASAQSAGESFDLAECDRITRAGVDRLVSATAPAATALLLNAGDNTHANDGSHRTPESKNAMDMDGHHADSMKISAYAWAYAIRRMLEKHDRVMAWFLPGNHDPDAAFAIALALSMFFHDEPRVEIEVTRSPYRYLRFGKVLIGGHHGHGAKPGDLPLLMAVDRPADWGASEFRYVFIGHIHHDTVKEVQGVRVESLRTLAAKDHWHANKGYRALRDTRSILYAADYGEVERHTCSAAILSAARAA